MASNSDSQSEREQALNRLVKEYYQSCEQGTTQDTAEFIARHPEYADDLREFFSDLGQLQHNSPQRAADPEGSESQGNAVTRLAAMERPGTMIGPYKLLQKLGEGGMGAVYLAEQQEPVRRQVALKIIKAGMDSAQVIARFEQERQALAMMDHPNIARIIDAGTTGGQKDEGGRMKAEAEANHSSFIPHPSSFTSGRPYFVMELVKGIPITRYCDQEHLSPKERLELFIPVCQAVQHAHQKGIIHRDLKPSNVLIALYDGRPVPKVIDFGVAKATSQRLTERTLFTEVGSIVGTLEYMAPEQAELNNLDIDTRADIYSLGVLLYELLAGAPPFTSQQLRSAGFNEMLRIIKEVEPPKPSTKLSELSRVGSAHHSAANAAQGSGGQSPPYSSLASIAAMRRTEPAKLTKLIRGDLDWIVMKCLEKERSRRYETANAFALDIQRYLHDEAVLAGPPSKAYRLKKFLRRNKGPVLAAAVVLLTLLGGIIGTTWGLIRAEQSRRRETARAESEAHERRRAESAEETAQKNEQQANTERDRAVQAEADANSQRIAAVAEKQRADDEAAIAKAINDFLRDRVLRQASARAQADALVEAGGSAADVKPNPTIREVLDRAAAELTPDKIEKQFPNMPLVQAGILKTIGQTYIGMGQGEWGPGIAHLERSHDLYLSHLGTDHAETMDTLNKLGLAYMRGMRFPEGIQTLKQLHERQVATLGPDHPDTMETLHSLGNTYRDADRNKEAIVIFEPLREKRIAILGPDHPDTLATINNLGELNGATGRALESIPLVEHVRDRRVAQLGPDHPTTLWSQRFVAVAYEQARKLPQAIQILEPLREKSAAKLGPDNLLTGYVTRQLANLYQNTGRASEAIQLLQQAHEDQAARLGPNHLTTITSQGGLATFLYNSRKYAEALPVMAQVHEQWTIQLGPDHVQTLGARNDLAWLYQNLGRSKEAIDHFEQANSRIIANFGPDHSLLRLTFRGLGQAHRSLGQWNEAIGCFERERDLNTAFYGPKHSITLTALNNLAGVYASGGRLPDALRVWEELVPTARVALGPAHANTILYTTNWSNGIEQGKQFARAAEIRKQLLDEVQRSQFPANDPRLASALATLGKTLLLAEQFADAEPVIKECLTIRERAVPDDWQTFNAKSMLGGALAGQAKHADAEPLLLAGYEGLKQRESKIPANFRTSRLTEALQRLIDLYTAWEKPDEAARWRKELVAFQTVPAAPAKSADGA